MNAPKAAGLTAALALASVAGTALACGGDPMAKNLVAKPPVKSALRSAYLAAHPGVAPAAVSGPVAGRTYYGTVMGDWYAVATFSVAGRASHPTILVRHGNRRDSWHVVRETHGGICGRFVPLPLIDKWYLEQWRNTDCYVEPSA